MDPHKLSIGSQAPAHDVQRASPKADLGRGAHGKLEKSPTYESNTHFDANLTWGEKFGQRVKIAGLVAGAVITGALALGLLPLTIIGGILYLSGTLSGMSGMDEQDVVEGTASPERLQSIDHSQQVGRRLEIAGVILAAPAVGFVNCLNSIEKVAGDSDLFYIKQTVKNTLSDVKQEAPDLQENHVVEMKERRWSAFEGKVGHLNKIKLKKLYKHVQGLNENNCPHLGSDEKKRVLEYMRNRIRDLS